MTRAATSLLLWLLRSTFMTNPAQWHLPSLRAPSASAQEAPQRGSEWGLGEKGGGKAHKGDNQPLPDAELPSLPLTGSKSRLTRTTHRTGHKASKRPPWSAVPGNLTPAMSHPLHKSPGSPWAQTSYLSKTDTPVSWRQGEVLHLELFFSLFTFSASLENVAILTVRCHWSHASWWNRTWKAGRWRLIMGKRTLVCMGAVSWFYPGWSVPQAKLPWEVSKQIDLHLQALHCL